MNVLTVVLAVVSVVTMHQVLSEPCHRRVCFYDTGVTHRKEPKSRMPPEYIDPSLCTHILYGFAHIQGETLVARYPEDESTGTTIGNYQKVLNRRTRKKDLKVMLSLYGWDVKDTSLNSLFDKPDSLKRFVDNTIGFLKERDFDGLDIFILYEGNRYPNYLKKLPQVFRMLRQGFSQTDCDELLLTATVYRTLPALVDINIINDLDWIHILNQDLVYNPAGVTVLNSALYSGKEDEGGPNRLKNAAEMMRQWMLTGIPKEKIIMGVPLFGRAYVLKTSNTGYGAPQSKYAPGRYNRDSNGYYSYFEVCEMVQAGAELHYMKEQRVPYLVSGNLWVTYEDVISVREKVRFLKKNNLGGFVVYSLGDDDFSGRFCCNGSFPLLNAMNDECDADMY